MARAAELLTLLLIIAALPASAGRITLETEATCKTVADAGQTEGGQDQVPAGICALRITNRGDEAATDLTIGLELDAVLLVAERVARLDPDASWEGELEIAPEVMQVGRNGFVIRVDYHDREGYPLAAVSHAYLSLGPPRPQDLQARLSPVALSGEPGSTILEVHNTGTRLRALTARLIVPRTLRSDSLVVEAVLMPGEDVELTFTIDNFSAFADSTYRIYALLESDLDGIHEAVFVPANAVVTSGERPTARLRTVLAAVAGLLAGAWWMAQFRPSHQKPAEALHRSPSDRGERPEGAS